MKKWISARLVTVSLTPSPGLACRASCWPSPPGAAEEKASRVRSLLQTVGVAEGLEAVSRGDPSEVRRDKQRETAAVQTQSDDEPAAGDDEGEICRREEEPAEQLHLASHDEC